MKRKILCLLLVLCMIFSMSSIVHATDSVFTDVDSDSWYAKEVKYVFENGIMNGVSDDLFDAKGNVTRAMVWTTIARQDGIDTTESDPWWLVGQQWAIDNGISDGTMADKNTTREQFITMLYRYAKFKGYDVNISEDSDISSFSDASLVSEWAFDAMRWACSEGLVNGIEGKLLPKDPISRAQQAVVLYRYAEESTNEEKTEPKPEVVTPSYSHSHSYGNWVPVEAGKHTGTCSCSDSKTEDCTYSEWTSNNNGTHSRTCSVCGYTNTETCLITTGEGNAVVGCADCGFSDVIVVDSITELLNTINATRSAIDGSGTIERTNEGKTILVKKGEYSTSNEIGMYNISINIIGERNADGTVGVSITQTASNHVMKVMGSYDPNNLEHVVISGFKLNGGKAGVENRGNAIVDLYDLQITDTGWNAISLDICSDDVNDIKITVNAHNVDVLDEKHAQINAHPKQSLGTLQYFNYAEFNFDAECSDNFKEDNGFINVEPNIIGKNNILINGQYYQPKNWTIDADGNIEIFTATGLKEFSANHNKLGYLLEGKSVKLMNDIELTGTFTPIGTTEHPFKGTFDGNGNTISGLTAGTVDSENIGLFGVLDGTVKNLTIENAKITGKDNIGIIAGNVNATGSIESCNVVNSILTANSAGGGIAGTVASGGIIKNNIVSNSAIICTDLSDGATIESCSMGAIVGANAVGSALDDNNNEYVNVDVIMSYVYNAETNTYTVSTPNALTKAFNNAQTVNDVKPTIVLTYGEYDSIIIPNNDTGNATTLAGITLKGSNKSTVGHLNLNCIDGAIIDGITFDAGKARSSIQASKNYYESISSGIDNTRHGCSNIVIQNCVFTGEFTDTGTYDCVRFVESIADNNGNNKRAQNITVNNCKFMCNAEQYLRLDYVYGSIKIINNIFGGSGFGTSHNNINATGNHADFEITGNIFNNWGLIKAYAFGSSHGADVKFTITRNIFNNTASEVIWLKNYTDATHNTIELSENSYTGGLTQTDADAVLRVTG